MTDLYLQPVTFKEASSSFIKSQPLHTPHGPSLPASRFLRQAAVLRNELLPTIWKKKQRTEQRLMRNHLQEMHV